MIARKQAGILRWQTPILVLVLLGGLTTALLVLHRHRAGGRPQPAATDRVILGENPIPLSALTILATKDNYYSKHSLQVESRIFTSGRAALDAVLSGDAQFATVAETPLVLAAFANERVVVVATMSESKEEMQLVVRSDRIHTLKDLKGSTMATARGTNADYFMYAFLNRLGIGLDQVRVLNMKPGDMVNAFDKGSISGYFSWQPFAYDGMKLKNTHPVSYSGKDFYTMTFNIVTSRNFATQHPDQVENFLRALKDAADEIKRDPSAGEAAVMDRTGMDKETLDALWPTYDFGLRLNDSLISAMEEQRSWAADAGNYSAANKPDFCSLMAPEALRAIDPNAVSLTCGL